MSMRSFIRRSISRNLSGQKEIRFQKRIPEPQVVEADLHSFNQMGLYLHIPFCDQICPYCPYNKTVYRESLGEAYVQAVIQEIKRYAPLMADQPVTSFYIGGGTPTTLLGKGMEQMIESVYSHFKMECDIHMESHPNHLTSNSLDLLEALGVSFLSIGVESLQDKYLKMLERPYTVAEVKKRVEGATSRGFKCVNIDFIFDLPGQTECEVEQAAHEMVELGIHQAATYPLFRFPYTRFGREQVDSRSEWGTLFRRRRLLKMLESVFYEAGFYRSSVWAFTRQGINKYCSVTVPQYLGLGASGGSYLRNLFYVNTFDVEAYIKALRDGNSPIALTLDLPERAQMAGWLYWRLYETAIRKQDFRKRFNREFDKQYGRYTRGLKLLGFLRNGQDQITLTDRGTYWIHAFEDFFSIDYINKLWGTSRLNPWPDQVTL